MARGHLICWIAAGCLLTPVMVLGQASASEAGFAVVSIKPSQLPESEGYSFGVKADGFTASNVPLFEVLQAAYLPEAASIAHRLKGAPDWAVQDGYDIKAKVEDATAEQWGHLTIAERNLRAAPLLRKMLEERCQMVVHMAPVEIDGLALVVDKGGVKAKPTPADGAYPAAMAERVKQGPDWIMQMRHGGMISTFDPGKPDPTFFRATIQQVADWYSGGNIVIVDQTGLKGSYDIVLWRDEPPPGAPRMSEEERLHALQWGELGLRLKPVKVTVQQLVIDRMERPTPN